MTISPPYLNSGDTVVILAPARKISREELQPAIDLLEGWGLNVVFGQNLFGESHQFSGTVRHRAQDFQESLDNDEVKAIWCARGGYGSIQLIDHLDFSGFKKNPKWIVGFSDVTVFHNHINQNFGIQTLHGTMPLTLQNSTNESVESLRKALFGDEIEYEKNSHSLNRKGTARGELVGGNLSIIYSLMGSSSQLKTEGKILFLEDLDEYLYHIDRMMQNLKRGGLLNNLAGLVVGGMTVMNDNTIPFGKTAEEIILDVVKEYDYPVCFDFPSGHIKNNCALIMGRNINLAVGENVKLRVNS